MRRRSVKVRVPATTSNLGPGFDVLGLALGLYNDVELDAMGAPGPLRVEVRGEGAAALPKDGSNMAVQAALTAARPHAKRLGALHFRFINRIPLARGLGSSAAARLGGLLAVRALLDGIEARSEGALLEACLLEGHPDNVVPAFHGGLCAVHQDGGILRVAQMPFPRDLAPVVCVPGFELPTAKARAALPERVPRADAVGTSARLAFLLAAFAQRRYGWLRFAMTDVLHQPHRKRLVPGFDRVVAAALQAGAWGASLSGAGPSVLALAPPDRVRLVGRVMERAWHAAGVKSLPLALPVDRRGAAVEGIS